MLSMDDIKDIKRMPVPCLMNYGINLSNSKSKSSEAAGSEERGKRLK